MRDIVENHDPLGGPRQNIAIMFGTQILVWWRYQMVKSVRICVLVSIQFMNVMDGQTPH